MTTYYVNNAGSDTNTGNTPTSAWKTVNKVNGFYGVPGDRVLFQAQQTFADATLMPPKPGVQGNPITYGVHGKGRATITQGVWSDEAYISIRNLILRAGLQGGTNGGITADGWVVYNTQILCPPGHKALGLAGVGDHWVIQNSTVMNAGLSAIQMFGDAPTITGCTIDRPGQYTAGYNPHGMYLDASNATITNNNITNFGASSAISCRYRNATIEDNNINTGGIGIDFFQTDTVAGTTSFQRNTIMNTTAAGIYTSIETPLMESFIILDNTIPVPTTKGWQHMNLGATTGKYQLDPAGK